MITKEIQNQKKNNNVASYVATGLGGAALGAGAVVAGFELIDDAAEGEVENDTDTAAEEQTADETTAVPVETQPVTPPKENPATEVPATEVPTTEVTPGEDPAIVVNNILPEEDPEVLAEELIAGVEIDPTDIDLVNDVVYESIGTVYMQNGESYTAACFHDAATGQEMLMVDVDGDNSFDLITDLQGNVLANLDNAITVDDVQLNLFDDVTYMAHDDSEVIDEYGAESLDQDMIC